LLLLLLRIFFKNIEGIFLGRGYERYKEYNLEIFIIDSYVLFVTTIFMLVDLFCNQRDKVEFNWCSCVTYTIIYFIYFLIIYILFTNIKYFYSYSYSYIFIIFLNPFLMIFVNYALLIVSYFIYTVVSNKINRKFFEINENVEDEKLIDDETEEKGNLSVKEE